ncbi:HAD family hydrolase [Aliikangiella sp. IMCC44359]|uniref:HAD family hydrolase n=1 Tax=Aliikangiella sp. IMCC44359 TaxID=3459125 RepID=UPI00403B1448
MIKAIFFDFDGTLADTAPDLVFAINELLISQGKQKLPYEKARPYVSGGSPALIKLGFNIDHTHSEFEALKAQFLKYYENTLERDTLLFPGIQECLDKLTQNNITWGIITNKPEFLTTPIVTKLGFTQQASVIISGDTYTKKKPDPYPLIQACKLSKVAPEKSLYIGDDERDIIAAKKANIKSICAEWGYLSEQNPKKWNADYYIKESQQLGSFLDQLMER